MNTPMNSLSKSAQTVQDALLKHNIEDLNVIELDSSTRTAVDAASALKCEVDQIVKSLIFRTKETNKPILVLCSGGNRVNEKTIGTYVQEKIEKADADFTRSVTGFAIGGIPPLGHTEQIPTFIDEDLLKFQEIWAAAGTPNAVFKIQSSDLQKITHGKIISLK